MVTHRETTSCFTKIYKVSTTTKMPTSWYQRLNALVKNYNTKTFCLTKINMCVFFSVIFHFGNSQRIFTILVSSYKMLSKSNTFIGISNFSSQIQKQYFSLSLFDFALLSELRNRPWKTNFIVVFLVLSFHNTWLNVISHGFVQDLW